jgi:hypothetical protein
MDALAADCSYLTVIHNLMEPHVNLENLEHYPFDALPHRRRIQKTMSSC